MKKTLAAAGVIILALTLTGCGKDKGNDCPDPQSLSETAGFPAIRPAPVRPAPAPRPAPRPVNPAPKPAPRPYTPPKQQQRQQHYNNTPGFWPWLWFNNDRRDTCR